MDRKKIALIHIIKKEIGLCDDEYRAILRESAGVTSSKLLDDKGFKKLMAYFVRSTHYRINENGFTLRQKLFIQHLAIQLGWTHQHLDRFITKYYHISDINLLSRRKAAKLIESLKNVQAHKRQEPSKNRKS